MKLYTKDSKKRIIQDYILDSTKNDTIFCLGGPNISEYISLLRDKGFKTIISFEQDKDVYRLQKKQKPDCQIINGNILDYLGYDAFYDYDFCSNIHTIEKYLPHILKTKHYSATFSLRPISKDITIRTFKRYSEANYITYFDTSNMITFFS